MNKSKIRILFRDVVYAPFKKPLIWVLNTDMNRLIELLKNNYIKFSIKYY